MGWTNKSTVLNQQDDRQWPVWDFGVLGAGALAISGRRTIRTTVCTELAGDLISAYRYDYSSTASVVINVANCLGLSRTLDVKPRFPTYR